MDIYIYIYKLHLLPTLLSLTTAFLHKWMVTAKHSLTFIKTPFVKLSEFSHNIRQSHKMKTIREVSLNKFYPLNETLAIGDVRYILKLLRFLFQLAIYDIMSQSLTAAGELKLSLSISNVQLQLHLLIRDNFAFQIPFRL